MDTGVHAYPDTAGGGAREVSVEYVEGFAFNLQLNKTRSSMHHEANKTRPLIPFFFAIKTNKGEKVF